MVPRFLAFGAVIFAVWGAGCGGDFSVAFEPLESMGGSAGVGGVVLAGASASMGGNAHAGAGSAGETASAGSAGAGGAGIANCQELGAWIERSYALGERVRSMCKAPYNGACPVNTLHTFECQPPTGLVGLGWCTARQPGVGNGWAEAWLLKAECTN